MVRPECDSIVDLGGMIELMLFLSSYGVLNMHYFMVVKIPVLVVRKELNGTNVCHVALKS